MNYSVTNATFKKPPENINLDFQVFWNIQKRKKIKKNP